MADPNQTETGVVNPKTNLLAIISFTIALLGIVTNFLIPIIAQVGAIVCGHIARYQIRHSNGSETGNGLALAGLIIGYLTILSSVIVYGFLGLGLLALFNTGKFG